MGTAVIGNQLLVRRKKGTEEGKMTPGGLHIPENVKDHDEAWVGEGEVIHSGPGHYDGGVFIQNPILKGSIVKFQDHLGRDMNHEGEKLTLMNTDAIICVVYEDGLKK